MRRINIPEGVDGIQEVSGSIPLISTIMNGQESSENVMFLLLSCSFCILSVFSIFRSIACIVE